MDCGRMPKAPRLREGANNWLQSRDAGHITSVMNKIKLVMAFFAAFAAALALSGAEPPKVALVVKNAKGSMAAPMMPAFGESVAAGLNARGYSVIMKDALTESLSSYESGAAGPQAGKPGEGASLGDIKRAASAVSVARMVGADWLLVVSVNSLDRSTREFSDFGTKTLIAKTSLGVSYSLYSASSASGVDGGSVSVSSSTRQSPNLKVSDADTVSELFSDAASRVASQVSLPEKMREPAALESVEVEFVCSVEGMFVPEIKRDADGAYTVGSSTFPVAASGVLVEIDGVAAGSAGSKLSVARGLHQARLSGAGLEPVSMVVNAGPKGGVFGVSMRMTESARERWLKDAAFFQSLKAGAVLTDAQAKVLEGLSEAYGSSGYRVDYRTDTSEPLNVTNQSLFGFPR